MSPKGLAVFTILLFLLNFSSKVVKEVFFIRIYFYPSTLLKLAAVVFLLVYFIMYMKSNKFTKYIYILCAIFGIDFLLKIMQQVPVEVLYNRFYFFMKGLFFYLCVITFKDLKKEHLEKTVKTLFVVAKINLILSIFGVLLEINLFKSYPNSSRFGFNGIIAEPGIGTYFYILLATISYLKYRYQKSSYITLILMILAILLLGTKSGYLFIGILGLIHMLYLLKKQIYQVTFISILALAGYLLKDKLIQLAVNSFNFGPVLYEKHGLITFVSSKRDLLLKETVEYMNEHWSIINYLIGGMDFKIHRVEFEFIDVFLFHGVIGVCMYLLVLKKIFLTGKKKLPYTLLFLTVLLISALTGNLFFSITNSFCFIIVFLYLDKSLLVNNIE